jgi:hypothetical protein
MNQFELNAPVGGQGNRKIAPEGMHIARCCQIIDLGTSEQGGNYPGKKRKVNFVWELPNELEIFDPEKGAQPFIIKSQFTLSFNEKSSLRKCVENWVGKKMSDQDASKFNIGSLLGKPCMINVVHNNKGEQVYANVGAITPLPRGMECPQAVNKQLAFNAKVPNMEVFNQLPQFIQDKIKESDEFISYMNSQMNNIGVPQVDFSNQHPIDNKDNFFSSALDDGLPF